MLAKLSLKQSKTYEGTRQVITITKKRFDIA